MDFDSLREDLIDYFGSASGIIPIAMADVIEVETADEDKLIDIAQDAGFDLDDYKI